MDCDTSEDDQTVYADSSSNLSSRSSGGGGSSGSSSSLYSSDSYLHATVSCCCRGCAHYEEVCGDKATTLCSVAERRLCGRVCGERSRSFVVISKARIQTRSNWTASWLLCSVSALVAACSLGSLATCIAVTGFSMSFVNLSRVTASTSSAESGVGRDNTHGDLQVKDVADPLLWPALEDRRPSSRHHWTPSVSAAHYRWDCVARAGRAKCRPVHKAESPGKSSLLGARLQYRPSVAAFRTLVDGVYHVSTQVAGTAWQRPPTLLRVVIARVTAKFGAINVTTVHSITGVGGYDDAFAADGQRGAFSVYTAANVRLNAGDELMAQVVCVEEPNCVVHVNGTASHLALQRLN